MNNRHKENESTVLAIDSLLRGQVNDPDPLPPMFPGSVSVATTYGLAAGLLREVKKLRRAASQEGETKGGAA